MSRTSGDESPDWSEKLLTSMFVLMVVVSALAIVGALIVLAAMNASITTIVVQASQRLTDPDVKALLTKLEYLSQRGIDSGVMQFLFEVFSGALVVAGVYLVDQSRKNLRKMKRRTRDLETTLNSYTNLATQKADALDEKFLATSQRVDGHVDHALSVADRCARDLALAQENTGRLESISADLAKRQRALDIAPTVWRLTAKMIQAHQVSCRLRDAPTEEIAKRHIPSAREATDQLHQALEQASDGKVILEDPQFEFFLDELSDIHTNLAGLVPRTQALERLLGRCDACRELLKTLHPASGA